MKTWYAIETEDFEYTCLAYDKTDAEDRFYDQYPDEEIISITPMK